MKKSDVIIGAGLYAVALSAAALSLGNSRSVVVLGSPIDLTFEVQPEMLVASTLHVGSYERFGEAYAALLNWTQERGFEVNGPVREVYLRVGEREEDHLSELQVPVRPKP